jgi:hypothetical protein
VPDETLASQSAHCSVVGRAGPVTATVVEEEEEEDEDDSAGEPSCGALVASSSGDCVALTADDCGERRCCRSMTAGCAGSKSEIYR